MVSAEHLHGTLERALPHPLDLDTHAAYPARQWVDPSQRDWGFDMPDYKPPFVESPRVAANRYPEVDPPWRFHAEHPFLENYHRMGLIVGRDGPHNPRLGRTGLTGRGEWKHYGPNYATDLAHIRVVDGMPFVLAVIRADSGKPALVGGKLKRTDHPSGGTDHYSAFYKENIRLDTAQRAIARELPEETGLELPDNARLNFELHSLTGGPRTTDIAWAESDVWSLVERADDLPEPDEVDDPDILGAAWLPMSRHLFVAGQDSIMHSAHGPFLQFVAERHGLVVPSDWTGQQMDMILCQLPDKAADEFVSRGMQPMLY